MGAEDYDGMSNNSTGFLGVTKGPKNTHLTLLLLSIFIVRMITVLGYVLVVRRRPDRHWNNIRGLRADELLSAANMRLAVMTKCGEMSVFSANESPVVPHILLTPPFAIVPDPLLISKLEPRPVIQILRSQLAQSAVSGDHCG